MTHGPLTPGEAIQAALTQKGWTHEDLARVLGCYRPEVTTLISGVRSVSAELAVRLSKALGQTPQYWLNLEAQKQLQLIPIDDASIAQRALAFSVAPVKHMVQRGWISDPGSDDGLLDQLCNFFGTKDLDNIPEFGVATRRSDAASALTSAQRAWCVRARQLARAVVAPHFDEREVAATRKRLRELAAFPKEARLLPEVLRKAGIRFVVVEPLPNSKIDGAAFWLDERSPCIAVSARFDRIDSFWFTVMHEFGHIAARDAVSVDYDHGGDDYQPSSSKDEIERRADQFASDTLVPPDELHSFIRRVGPLYEKTKIVKFAHRIKMHPGIIVGQLQHLGEIGYGSNREMLAKVRSIVVETALTDGYGRSLTPGTI